MDLNDIKRQFLEAGGNLQHKRVQAVLNGADRKAREEASRLSAPPNAAAAKWITTGLGWLAIGFFFVVLLVGVAALLITIPAAEFAAVYTGLSVVTPGHPEIAGLTTAALFIGIIVLMFLRHVYEDALPRSKPKTGLRRYAASVGTWLGFRRAEQWHSGDWTKVERDYVALAAALNVSKAAVLSASLVGRLQQAINNHADKPLVQALESVRDTLTGQEAIGALVSLFILYGILKMLDVGVLFSYTAFKNSAGALDLAEARPLSFLEHYSALKDQYQADALNDLTMQMQARQQTNRAEE